MTLDYPVATPLFRRVVLVLVAGDLLLIGTHVVLSLAWMLDLLPVRTGEFRITRNGSWAEVFNQVKWAVAALALGLAFWRTRVPAFGAFAVIFAMALADDWLKIHQQAAWRLTDVTGWGPLGKLVAFAVMGAIAVAVLVPSLRRTPPAVRPQVMRFLGVLAGMVALGVVFDFVHVLLARLGQIVDQAGGLFEDGGEMILASLAAAYAVAACRWAWDAARPARA